MVAAQPVTKDEAKAPTKPKTASEPDHLDAFFDGLLRGTFSSESIAQSIALGLNEAGRFRVWDEEHTGAVDILIAEILTRLVVEDRRLTEEEKWGVQRWYAQRAVLWSRACGIMNKLGQDALLGMSGSGFLSDSYAVPPAQRYMGRVSGMLRRWAGGHVACQHELEYGLQLLSSGAPGVTLSITNLPDGKAGRVRVTFADQA
jgi:hypothetical protein